MKYLLVRELLTELIPTEKGKEKDMEHLETEQLLLIGPGKHFPVVLNESCT